MALTNEQKRERDQDYVGVIALMVSLVAMVFAIATIRNGEHVFAGIAVAIIAGVIAAISGRFVWKRIRAQFYQM